MIISNVIILMAALVAGVSAQTKVFNYHYAGIKIEFPAGWHLDYSDEEPDVLYANSADEEMIVMIAVQPLENLDSVYSNLQSDFLQDYTIFKIIKKESKKINGLTSLSGRAKLSFEDGYFDILTFAIIRIPESRVLIITTVNDEESNRIHSFEINNIINSIKIM